jgi:serine/threonine protein kinase
MYWCGQEGDFNFLIMELLGDNLEEIFVKCRRYFSLKTIVMLADRLLQNIEYLHFKSLLHRDLKPENFLIGAMPNKQHKIFTIDYGLAKKYRDSVTHEHIPFREKKPLIGTARYASVNAHIGFELSRRDDLETLGYIIIYFAR